MLIKGVSKFVNLDAPFIIGFFFGLESLPKV